MRVTATPRAEAVVGKVAAGGRDDLLIVIGDGCCDGEAPFLYGAAFMANAASLLLPGSNLTNLIVLAREHIAGAVFAARTAPAWLVSLACVEGGARC